MSGQLFRIQPVGPAESYKTYQFLRPKETHTRVATCAEVNCAYSNGGWRTTVDVSTELGQKQANYIRLHSGRSFTFTETGTLIVFAFPSGQKCFAEHRVSLEREPIFRVKGGDWRGNPRRVPIVTRRPEDWVDDFAENQIKVAERIQRG